MKSASRLLLYVALFVSAVASFGRFSVAYRQAPVVGPVELTANPGDAAPTNEPVAVIEDASATNAAAGATNVTLTATNRVTTNAVAAPRTAPPQVATARPPARAAVVRRSDAFVWFGLFVFTLLALAGLAAWDFTRYLGGRTERAMMATDFLIPADPDYEAAEEEWAKGNHLDALNLMRDYLKRNPNEQHVAIRIAEIYEKDLNNYLAAALELEEVLTKKLPREKWGWTAIRLANLYSGRLNQSAKALAVLDRIVKDYPDTGAAKKARQRLGLPEPETAAPAVAATEPEPSAPPAAVPEEEPSNLPICSSAQVRGFVVSTTRPNAWCHWR